MSNFKFIKEKSTTYTMAWHWFQHLHHHHGYELKQLDRRGASTRLAVCFLLDEWGF
jgi:hypothetical protein